MKIVHKLQPINDVDLVAFLPNCVQFQLEVVYDKYVDRQQSVPASLNYFGLLGPTGSNFGEMVYHCKDCILEHIMYKTIEFQVQDALVDINFNAMVESPNDAVEVKFEEVPASDKRDVAKAEDYESAFLLGRMKGKQTGMKSIVNKGKGEEKEESLYQQGLKSGTKYRVVILNTADAVDRVTFTLRLELIEQPRDVKQLGN